MIKHKLFLGWALFVSVLAVLSVMAIRIGAIGWIHSSDRTYISFAICVVGYLGTLLMGRQYWRADRVASDSSSLPDAIRGLRNGRFLSDKCRDLGLLGTIIGFVLILKNFASFDATQPDQLSTLIRSVGSNLGTAFVTTLAGLVASILLDAQCHILESILRKAAGDD